MVISRTRLAAPLTRGNVPEEHATEFSDALAGEVEVEIERAVAPFVPRTELEQAISRAIAPLVKAVEDLQNDVRDLRRDVADLRVEMEARETRMGQRMFNFAFASVGIVLAAIGIATGLIVALGRHSLLRAHLREENHVADRLLVGQQHRQAIHTHPQAARRRHAVLQRPQEVLIE